MAEADYYRVWQGFKKPELSQSKFLSELPQFMNDTVDLYRGRALNNYLVGLPPKDHPSFIPDEFALVALHSEVAYREIRKTPEGREYGRRHWDVFNKENSNSAPFKNYYETSPKTLEHNVAYDLIGKPVDWSKGHTLFFIGTKKDGLSSQKFLTRLSTHVDMVTKTFKGKGFKGYIVIANEKYEVAYINWESKELADAAYATEEGKAVFTDAKEIMNILQFNEAKIYEGGSVEENKFYTTIQ
jgi:hypothetical protein